ncbi:unnamed protein product [Prorocentrum cordatum]|uniref:Uncharacterized protein n=1 Tax=Prorocentrum cordatum TaxID=2364126 RepID=A0ABN9QZ45_9DINO|nr:unnamed protein product [Polarella glacialis]
MPVSGELGGAGQYILEFLIGARAEDQRETINRICLIAEVADVYSHNLWSRAWSDYSQRQEEDVSSDHDLFESKFSAVYPGILKEELHDEKLQDIGMQNEELLNEQLHYSHHTYYMASRSEECHTSASDADQARHGNNGEACRKLSRTRGRDRRGAAGNVNRRGF